MDISPEPNYEANQPKNWQWLLIAVIALVVLCGIVLFISGGYFVATGFFENRQERATQAAAGLAATQAAADNRATEIVAQKLAQVEKAAAWPVLLSDTFDDNRNEWYDQEFDDEYALISFKIDGEYTWEMQSRQGVVWRVWPSSDIVDDFYLAVDARNIGDNPEAQYGLIFRNNEDAYIFFEVRDTQNFSVSLYWQGEWTDLIPYTFSSAIHPGEFNHLEIAGQGEDFWFLINDQFIGQAHSLYPDTGQAGLAIGLDYADENALIVFDNFELRGNSIEE